MSTAESIPILRARRIARSAPRARAKGLRVGDRDHVFLGNDFHRVEDEAVVLEDDEVNVLAPDQFDRAADGGISQNGRALLREFDEENFAGPPCGGRTRFDDFSPEGQKETERNTDPSIRMLQGRDADRKIHCEERSLLAGIALRSCAFLQRAARVIHAIDHTLGGPRHRMIARRQQTSENWKIAHRIMRVLRRNLDIDDVGRRMFRKILFEIFPGARHDPFARYRCGRCSARSTRRHNP